MRPIVFATILLSLAGTTIAQTSASLRTARDFQGAERQLSGLPTEDYTNGRRQLHRQALEIIAQDPGTEEGEELLHWILRVPVASDEATEAVEQLVAHHAGSEKSVRLLLGYAQRPASWTPDLFEAFLEANLSNDNAWIVEACEALHSKSLLMIADEIQASKSRSYESQLGIELTEDLAERDVQELETQVVQSFITLARKYGGKRMPGMTMKEFCNGSIFSIQHLRLGKTVGELEGASPDGDAVSLTDHREKVVLVDFWATWCAPCIVAIPELKRLATTLDADRFVVIGVSADRDKSQLTKAIASHGIDWPVVHDYNGALQKQWQSLELPFYYVLDVDRTIMYRGNDLRTAIEVSEAMLRRIRP